MWLLSVSHRWNHSMNSLVQSISLKGMEERLRRTGSLSFGFWCSYQSWDNKADHWRSRASIGYYFSLSDSGEAKNEILGKKVSLKIQLNEAKAKRDFSKQKMAEEKLSSLPALPNSRDDLIWSIIITSFTIVLLINGKFSLIEKFCIILVSSFTLITILNLIALQSQDSWAIR